MIINKEYRQLYDGLLKDIHSLSGTDDPDLRKTETCFTCCLDYWTLIKKRILHDDFENDKEEIDFFKFIKPRFTGQLEFYRQAHQYLLFCPKTNPAEISEFQQRELGKIGRFRHVHQDFIAYYVSDSTDKDHQFFLRRNCRGEHLPYAQMFDLDQELITSHDWILTKLAGFGLYREFVKERYAPESKAQP